MSKRARALAAVEELSRNTGRDRETASVRKSQILMVAAELFAANGFQATGIREIGKAAGILSGSLYHHFSSKEEILEELLRTYVEELPALYEGIRDEESDTKEFFEKLLRARIWSALKHPNLLRIEGNEHEFLRQDSRFDFMREAAQQVESIWRGLVEEGQQAKVFREDIDVRLVLRLMMSLITSTVRWYRPGHRYSSEVIVDHIVDMVMRTLCVEA